MELNFPLKFGLFGGLLCDAISAKGEVEIKKSYDPDRRRAEPRANPPCRS
jgi:hypothetical protein